jgi:dipeptidyl aminopeptidase/acylaminoacyl peptidase
LVFLLVLVSGSSLGGWSENVSARAEPKYTIAFASFGPRNTDLFVADADGKNPKPLVPHADNDYNASFSPDGRWIVFSSHRNGSADLYRVHPDGTGQERLTDDPAFDDQAALSPDGRQLVFVSNRGGHANLWLLELATKEVTGSVTIGTPSQTVIEMPNSEVTERLACSRRTDRLAATRRAAAPIEKTAFPTRSMAPPEPITGFCGNECQA